MKTIIKNFIKQYHYQPTIYELYNLYTSGNLILTDKQEDELLKEFEKVGLY